MSSYGPEGETRFVPDDRLGGGVFYGPTGDVIVGVGILLNDLLKLFHYGI
jgi:hypothetical protein